MARSLTQDEFENLAESITFRISAARDFLALLPTADGVPTDEPRRPQLLASMHHAQEASRHLTNAMKALEELTPQLPKG